MATRQLIKLIRGHDALRGLQPESALLLFDLDETLFNRSRATQATLSGRWRSDTPSLVLGLMQDGYKLGILSSAQFWYIDAALLIYRRQFGHNATEIFTPRLTTRDYDPQANKLAAMEAVALEMTGSGITPVFIDDARLIPDQPYIWVPTEYQCSIGAEPVITVNVRL